MSNTVHYQQCPVCSSVNISEILSAKDYTVSGEEFNIFQCSACGLRFTQDAPGEGFIGSYYKSQDYISHSDTSKGLINWLYRTVRRISLDKKRKLVQKKTGLKKGSLLDMGSGTGYFVAGMKHAGWQVTGLEPDAEARKLAQDRNKVNLLHTGEFFKLPPDSYDAITLWHVLEHVHQLHQYIMHFKILLKEKGKLFVAVPNYTSYDAEVYKQFWAGYDVPRHLYHFSPGSMKLLMEKHGLKIEDVKPMWFDSFYVSLLSSKYKNTPLTERVGKTNWISAAWQGLRSNLYALGDIKKCSSLIYIISK